MASSLSALDELTGNGSIASDWAPALRAVDPAIDKKVEAVLAKVQSAAPVLPDEA